MAKHGTGSKTSYHSTPEVTYGVTPATPTWEPICLSAFTLNPTVETIEDDCLRPDRQISGLRHGGTSVAGDITTRLSYGDFDSLLEGVMMGTWTANVLKSGVTFRSRTFEQKIELAIDEWHRYTGVVMDSMSITVKPSAKVDLSFTAIGQKSEIDTAEIAGSIYTAASDNDMFTSFEGSIETDGVVSAIITEITLKVENSFSEAPIIGSKYTIEPGEGQSKVTGTLSAYYESKALYERFINETSSAIKFSLVSPAGDTLEFDLPNIKYTGAKKDVSGPGDIMATMEFTAIYDGTAISQIVITRTPA